MKSGIITAIIFTVTVIVFLVLTGYHPKSKELLSNASVYDAALWKETKDAPLIADNLTRFRDKSLATGTDAAPKMAQS